MPILEEGLPALVAEGLGSGRLRFVVGAATAARDAEFVFLCVQTPQSETGAADLSCGGGGLPGDRPALRAGAVVVNKSTMPVGSTLMVARELSRAGAANDVGVASNPEFLREGNAVHDFLHPSRVVIGCDDAAVAVRVSDLYREVKAPILVTDPASAEMIKYASNAFLATKISFINAIANLCEAVNADVREVSLGMGYDPRIGFEFLHPGPGYGGSCFPKDTAALIHTAETAGYDFSLLRGVVGVNRRQHERMLEKLRDAAGGSLEGVTVGVWGLTFKANTDDLRDSPALVVCRRAARGGCHRPGVRPRRRRGRRRAGPHARRGGRPVRRGDRRGPARAAHRVGRIPLARLRPGGRRHDRAPRPRRRPEPARSRGDAPTRVRLPGRRPLMPRAVVTGGAGFVGSHLCDALRAREWEVVAVDNFLTGHRENVAHLADDAGFVLVEHDVIQGIPVSGPVDAVLHLASPASPPEYLARPIETLEVGAIGTQRALDLAREHGARFLLASTSEIYGDPLVHPQPETYFGNVNSVGPRSVYDEAKRYAEAITMAYHRTYGVDTKIVRVFNSILADEQVLYDDGTTFRRETVQELADRLGGPGELTNFSVPSFNDDCRVLGHVASHLVAHPPTGRCFEVTTRYGRKIRVTGDHSLFVEGATGKPVPRMVEDLRPGDRVALAGRIDITPRDRSHVCIVDMWDRLGRDPWRLSVRAPGLGQTVWDHRSELRPLLRREGIPGPQSSPASIDATIRRWRHQDEMPLAAHRALGIPIPSDARVRERSSSSKSLPRNFTVTDETLWLLGLFVAEGCHIRNPHDAFITFSCSEDLLERAAKVIERDLGLHVVWASGSEQRAPSIFIHSRLLLDVLDHLGFLAATKRIPGWVLGLPLSRLKWFIEGYREGDGVHSGLKFEAGIRHEFLDPRRQS